MFTDQRAQWLYKHFRWLEIHLPARVAPERPLILPTKTFYPDKFTRDHASAEEVFNRTKKLLEMQEWSCVLLPDDDETGEINETLRRAGVFGESSRKRAAGTFSTSDSVEITYSTNLSKDPIGLVATFAHELSHYLLATVKETPPAGWDELEPLTDLTAVVEGFGIFLCNSAFAFSGWSDGISQGWSTSQQGYLSDSELAFCLGIFCVRNRIDPKLAAQFLKPNPREVFADSLDYIADFERDADAS